MPNAPSLMAVRYSADVGIIGQSHAGVGKVCARVVNRLSFRDLMPRMERMELRIGQSLSALIKERRLTLREISAATGISSSTLNEWQSNRKPRDPVQVQRVATFFGVSLHFLLFGEEDHQEPLQRILKEDFFSGTFEITVKRVKLSKESC